MPGPARPSSRIPWLLSRDEQALERQLDERRYGVAKFLAHRTVDQRAVLVELLGRMTDAQLDLRPDSAERPRARSDHCDGLVAEDVGGDRTRRPVERVLPRTRNRRVVLRCREQHRVRVTNLVAERLDGERRIDLVVLIERWDPLQAVPQLDVNVTGRLLRSCAEECPVVRFGAEGAADRKDLHDYACTNVRSALSVTSFPRAGSPFGSCMFHLMSNCVRSMVVCSLKPTRVAPKWSTVGPVIVPVSVAGLVMPFSVSSPSISTSSPSRRISSETKVSSGKRSASKNSGDSRCAVRFSSFSCRLAMRAAPWSAPSVSETLKSVTSPRNAATA